jgi:adenosylmethionine-8-amino-7-oxononanoate aminotransferase
VTSIGEAIRQVIEVEGPETVVAIIVEPVTAATAASYHRMAMQRLRKICDDYA